MESTNQTLTNKNEDLYEKVNVDFSKSKKRNMEYWDSLDDETRIFVEKIAFMAGIKINEWGNEDLIKEIVSTTTKLIEERFDVKFPFVDEDF